MKQQFIISAVGPNVTGIVAQVSKEIHACGCNFEDSSMAVIGDHFALMILITGEDKNMSHELAACCKRLRAKGDLSIALFPIESPESFTTQTPEPNYELRVKGIDRMGIVYRTSQLLASRNINVVDMHTSVDNLAKNEPSIFTMKTLISVPEEVDGERLRKDLESIAEDLNDMISLIKL